MKLAGTGRPPAVWFVIEREGYGASAYAVADKARAEQVFEERLREAAASGEGYSPWDTSRRLSVQGPDVHERADGDDAVLYIPPSDDIDDPLLHWDIALRTVLGDDYELIANQPRAAAVLES